MLKKMLRVATVYLFYLLLTIIIFYVTGMYVFNQPPTPRVLTRMLLLPLLLTIVTIIIIVIARKVKK